MRCSVGRCLFFSAIICAGLAFASAVRAEDSSLNSLRAEIDELRKRIDPAASSLQHDVDIRVDSALEQAFDVQTRGVTLRIGGLLQVWAYTIRNDRLGLLNVPAVVPGAAGASATNNRLASNDSVRVRRAELRIDADITCNVSTHLSIDPARESTGVPSFPSNQGTGFSGDDSAISFLSCDCLGQTDPRGLGSPDGKGQSASVNRMLEDAYISYHDYVPHHDFQIGQMRRRLGEEGTRDDGELDFAERSMITQMASLRDLGVQAHGTWLDERLQYWIGAFDDAGTAFQQRGNRADDNSNKDIAATLQVRPLWSDCLGRMELGYSILTGEGGESRTPDPTLDPANDLNRRHTTHQLQYAWASYHMPGPARGWWVRGEWGEYRDRFAPGDVVTGNAVITTNPHPFNAQGWYVATGYKLGESAFAEQLPCTLKNFEFLFRYETMQNVFFHSLVQVESQLDLFKTRVYTAGVNYRLSGDNIKLQLNYNWVGEPDRSKSADDRQFRAVKNDSLVLNLQVEF